jgi:pyruvate,water dikinase
VAPAIDPGWLPTLSGVAGVVVETGGDLSHGSILLREIGIPAVTNVAGAMAAIESGDRIRLRGGSGTVEQIDATAAPTEPRDPGEAVRRGP